MKQIQIENGVIRYYGNRVGRVTEGCAVVDPMFQNEAYGRTDHGHRNDGICL